MRFFLLKPDFRFFNRGLKIFNALDQMDLALVYSMSFAEVNSLIRTFLKDANRQQNIQTIVNSSPEILLLTALFFRLFGTDLHARMETHRGVVLR